MIESVDEGIGKMIEALKTTGQYDHTIIVLISDHGGLSNRGNKRELATTNAPLKAGKGHLYEGGLRVPMLVHLPGQKENKTCDLPVMSFDLLPTLADLCNAPVDGKAELDGMSLKPALTGKNPPALAARDLFGIKLRSVPLQQVIMFRLLSVAADINYSTSISRTALSFMTCNLIPEKTITWPSSNRKSPVS